MLNVGTIIATLKLTDKLTPAITKAQSSLKRIGGSLKQTGATMRATGTSMTMGLTAPIVGGVAAAAMAFGGFEKSMNRVKALSGATGKDFDALTQQAKDLGKTTAFSAKEAADAMGFLAMAGFSTTKIIGAMPGVLELAASAQLDLASAADITSNILTGYGMQTEDLSRVNNVLVKSFTSANTDLTQLGVAFKYAGPVAKSAGMSFEEASASISMMGNAGIQGSMAGTSLRGAITKLLNPTKKAANEMTALGISATDAEGNLLPMADIVQQLGDRSASTSQMMTIFGLRAGPAMAGLVSQGHQALRKLTGELEGVGNIAKEITEVQMQGLAGAFTRFQSAASGAMIEMGEQLAPVLEEFLAMGIKLANWISNTLVPAFTALSPTTQKWIIGIVAVVAAMGPLLVILGTVVGAIGSLQLAIAGVSATMALAFVGVIAAVALAFGAWKLFQWAKEAQIFGRALDYVKNILGFLSDEEYAAAKAARKLNTDLGDVTPTAEALRNALGVAGVEGTVADLQQAMVNLAGVAGGLAEEEMDLIAQRAIQLREAGEDLTPELARIVTQFERQQVAAADAADALVAEEAATAAAAKAAEAAAVALAAQEEATAKLQAKTEDLRAELAGEGLAGELAVLQDAWEQLTPEQQANEQVMERVAQKAKALAEEGVVLSADLLAVAAAADEASTSTQELGTTMSATAKQAQRLSDEFSGKNLRKDVDALEMALGNLIVMEEDSAAALLQVGEAAEKLRDEGAKLSPGLAQLADDFVAAQSAANDFVGPPEQAIESTTAAIDLGKGLAEVWEGIPDLIVGALKGGGDAFKALGAQFGGVFGNWFGDKVTGWVSSKLGDKLGGALGGMMGPLGAMAGSLLGKGIGKAVGKIGGWFKGLFGKGTIQTIQKTAANMWDISLTKTAAKAAEEATKITGDAFTGMLMSLGAIIEESGGVAKLGFEKVAAAARDTFAAIDQGKLDAESGLEAIGPVLVQLAAEFENAGAEGQEQFYELIRLAQTFGMDMEQIVALVGQDLVDQALGQDLPTVLTRMKEGLGELSREGLDPMMAQ